MGLGEGKSEHGGSTERRLYRQGSLSSQVSNQDGDIQLQQVSGRSSVSGSLRHRSPSGKSIRSRCASRAEYHEDLKPSLKQGLTFNLCFQSFIILMGTSFLFGYNIGVLNQPSMLIKDFYNRTYTNRSGGEPITEYTLTFLWSLTNTLFLPGGMIGAYSAGFLADNFGRKKAVLLSLIPCYIGAVMSSCCLVANLPELLMAGRFFTGINCGFATQLGPMYLMEITPYNLRGAFGTANQLFITIGIFMGSVFGLREILGTYDLWPILLALNVVPGILAYIVLPFMPDSPRFLMLKKKQRIPAEKALRYLRNHVDVSADIEEMETELHGNEGEDKEEEFTMMMLLKTKALHMPLIVAIMLNIIQQLSGINAIFFYSTSIFKEAGVSLEHIQYFVIITNFINVAMTVVAVPLMDKAGRRPLLLYPMIVMIFLLALITAAITLQEKPDLQWMSYISIGCVFSYVICFAVGLGPIPMMCAAELFRQGPRPRAMSLAGLANWLFTIIISISFELIQKAIGAYTFLLFLVMMVFFVVFVYFKVPETKNKTFEEIAGQFQPGGVIEVEEIVDEDEVFSKLPNEDSKLMINNEHEDGRQRNGSVGSMDKDDSNVCFEAKGKNEEKMSLTRSEERIDQRV